MSAEIFLRTFFTVRTRSGLGIGVGKKDAIRPHRTAEQSERKMLRRVADLRSKASHAGSPSLGLSTSTHDEQRASRAYVGSEAFAPLAKSV
jgi:hypothetical protein